MGRRQDTSGWGGNGRSGSVARVLEALRSDGPSSQAALARRTRLSPATINNIVKQLRAEGAAEIRPVNGRESVVSLVSSRGAVVSVQVNVTSLHAALFDFVHRARYDVTIPFSPGHEGGSPAQVIEVVRSLVAEAGLETGDLTGVAVGMQAPIARPTGVVTSWARLQLPRWKDVPIADELGAELGVPVVADNDANLAALAEWTWGAGQGADTFLYVLCSEQVGGGLVLGGRIHRGGDGLAGEIGHAVLEPGGPVCFCGNRGCLTTFVAERPILATLEAAAGTRASSLTEVISAARGGDPACARVLFEAGRHLGRAFANAAKLVAPSVIAVGGLLGEAGELVFDGLTSSVEISNLRTVAPTMAVHLARLGADATLLGGAAAMMDHLGQGLSVLPDWMKTPSMTESFRG
ncbi:ROK family transcriptional regulator [Amycolatopsis thermoflava]|uniref:ROK family transcriptional regulator n=1 Tax=Amycolatopsis thermoflava TaxID=84480 RepID=UPI0004151074|nr:ROK family transcriptional regulator [Amycolatopsis thermoflava]